MSTSRPHTFITLADLSPNSYIGQGLKAILVKATEDGVEFGVAGGGLGDFVGPAAATDNMFVRFDGASGKLGQASPNASLADTGAATFTSVNVGNTGLRAQDSDASHYLTFKPTSNLTADRNFNVTTGDADRTLSMGGDITVPKNFTISGAYNLTLNILGATSVTFPTSGVLTTTANKTSDFAVPDDDLDLNGFKLQNLGTPTAAGDGANKSYVDAIASGFSGRPSCKYASVSNFAAIYLAGVLTATSNGAYAPDGFTVSVNDRVLLKNQADLKQNGAYVVTVVGTAGTPAVLTRATDFDTSAEIIAGNYFFISSGTTNTATAWILITPDPITLDTDDLLFTQNAAMVAYVAGNGIDITGLTVSAKLASSSGLTLSASGLAVDFTAVQAKNAGLDTLSAMSVDGLVCRTAANTFTARSLTSSAGLLVSNPAGIAGNPGIALDFSALTEDVSPVASEDFLATYDFSTSLHKKVKISNIAASAIMPRQVGAVPAEQWQSAAINAYQRTSFSASLSAGQASLYLTPFYWGGNFTVDALEIYVSTLMANTVGRIGIYQATSKSIMYPDALVVDAGEVSTATTGRKTVSGLSVALNAGTTYYFAYMCHNTAGLTAVPVIRGLNALSVAPILGKTAGSGIYPNTGYSYIGAYGALPATFPAGATTMAGTVVPAVDARLV